MPIPTAEDDHLAEIVEAGATALAELDGSDCFRPGHDTTADQNVRDGYRREARAVAAVMGPAVEAPLRRQLDNANEALIGTVENGPWVLIEDPALRKVVGEYVADACHSVAAAAGLDEAMERAHDATPLRLALALPELAQLAEIREWVDSYPPLPADVGFDPEALIVQRLRRILGSPGTVG